MGLGIVVLVIGIPIGLLMLFKPREVWHATAGWQFRNPEANEPSGVAYALGGICILVGTLILAVLAFTKPDESDAATKTTPTRWTPPSYSYTPPPPKPFTVPAPQNRGALPMIGYTTDGGVTTVYFYAPPATSEPAPEGRPRACDVTPRIEGADTEHVSVDVDLMWAPTVEEDANRGWACRKPSGDDPLVARSLVIGQISPTAELIASAPLPNMRLPKLAEPPRPLYSGV